MRQVALIGLLSFLTLLTGSCTIGDDSEEVVETTALPSPSVSPSPQVLPSPTPFASPTEPAKQKTVPAAAGLISSLPSEERIKQIAKGRSDPFAAIPVQPEVKVPNTPGGGRAVPKPVPDIPGAVQPSNKGNPGTTKTKSQGTTTKKATPTKATTKKATPKKATPKKATPKKVTPKKATPKKATNPAPKVSSPKVSSPNLPPPSIKPPSSGNQPDVDSPKEPVLTPVPQFTPELPELPEATLAKQIKVEGVVQVNEQPSAIVKVPNQPSQYVKEGQRLSNGRVLVKRIEASRGPTPIVILEENGIEVAKRVGEEPIGAPEEGGSQTAFIPVERLNLSHSIQKS
ncbi:MAG: hypothetical protein F6K14_08960 [Symploca sp. SIO2C1]|nr:hypothetical protein [Symploca sp. SIO2C1]